MIRDLCNFERYVFYAVWSVYDNVSLINVAQTFQFAKMCHKLKVCATIHASRIRNGVSERIRND